MQSEKKISLPLIDWNKFIMEDSLQTSHGYCVVSA